MSNSSVWTGLILNIIISMIVAVIVGGLTQWFVGVAMYFAVSMVLDAWFLSAALRLDNKSNK